MNGVNVPTPFPIAFNVLITPLLIAEGKCSADTMYNAACPPHAKVLLIIARIIMIAVSSENTVTLLS